MDGLIGLMFDVCNCLLVLDVIINMNDGLVCVCLYIVMFHVNCGMYDKHDM